jgi:hypothetical protein
MLFKTPVKHIIPLLLLLIVMASCGVYSFTGASIPPGAKTFSIHPFPNNAQLVQPTLSQVFNQSLQDIFLRQTNLTMVETNGDLHLEGSIIGYAVQPTAIGAGDVAAQNRLTISVRVVFINDLEPDHDFERTFSRFWDYPSSRNLAEIEDQAIREITQALVEDIFNQAVVNW